MRLALNLGYLTGRMTPADALLLAREAERLGFDCVWAAEAYSSDAPTLLAWIAGQTTTIGIGSAVMQIPARAPAMAAMTAATLDAVSGGRFRMGLGVSGPQVSEGWYGVPFGHPMQRTREYVAIVRLALDGKPVLFDGDHHRLPLPQPDGAPPGRARRLGMRPPGRRLPVYLAAIGPNNLRLTGEIADGWLGVFCAPDHLGEQLSLIAERRPGGLAGFDVTATVPVVIGEDPGACADAVRGYTALYVGGMGSRRRNFYNDLVTRMGFGDAARRVQELYLDGRHRDAAAALPLELLERTALLGPVDRVAEGLRRYAAAGVTTVAAHLVDDPAAAVNTLRQLAQSLERSGVGG